jgi:hypothetical protein
VGGGGVPCADGVGVDDLALVVLEQVGEGAVQDARGAHGEGSRVFVGVNPLPRSLHPDQPHLLVIHKLMEKSCR